MVNQVLWEHDILWPFSAIRAYLLIEHHIWFTKTAGRMEKEYRYVGNKMHHDFIVPCWLLQRHAMLFYTPGPRRWLVIN